MMVTNQTEACQISRIVLKEKAVDISVSGLFTSVAVRFSTGSQQA